MRTLQVADLATNPTLRQIVRQSYREQGLLTIRPTEKGLTKIDEFHPYFVCRVDVLLHFSIRR